MSEGGNVRLPLNVYVMYILSRVSAKARVGVD